MTEAELQLLLRKRYPTEGWALFARVPDGTGGAKTRTADAVAMCLWPSRGLELHGFEIKVSRADLLVELKDPAKAEAIARHCDRWWLVLADPAHLKAGELPPTWGLLAPKGGQLEVVTKAPKLAGGIPDHLRPFLASLLRVAQTASATPGELEAARAAGQRAGKREAEDVAARELRKVQDRAASLERLIGTFEQASGLRLGHYSGPRVGDAVRFVMAGGLDAARGQLEQLRGQAHRIAGQLDRQLEQLEAIASTGPPAAPTVPPPNDDFEGL